jgi:hypothetical protein
METVPAVETGLTAWICVELTTVTEFEAIPPNVTLAPVWNPLPRMVTVVPPVTGPVFGETLVTEPPDVYVKADGMVADWALGSVTVMPTVPELPGGAMAAICVELETVTAVDCVLPNLTLAPD